MKTAFLIFSLFIFSGFATAQRNVAPQVDRDPVLEADAKHNLEVVQQYFKVKKAYKAVLDRFEETYAAYPDYSKMDELLYYAGMSSFYLSNNKGKQKVDLKLEKDKDKYAPDKLRENAVAYLGILIQKYPNSAFKTDAEKTLKKLQVK